MPTQLPAATKPWSFLQKMFFRFFFIYFILYMAPWEALNIIPGIDFLIGLYNKGLEWMVVTSNEHIFLVFGKKHVQPVQNGSGDTSFEWAKLYFLLLLAAIAAVAWTLADRKRKSYRQLNYLLCLFIRYSLALISFSYGIQKIFALQMPFPLPSQLATPLGDYLPMRLSWMFIGYSTPYQVFSGVMEVLVAFLLLYRRTATLGTLIATAVFINVMMLNLCYDIPVKLYSMNIVLACLYLLANEYRRIACFFILNKPATGCSVYHHPLTKKWMRITRIIIKVWILALLLYSTWDTVSYYKESKSDQANKDFKPGLYEVSRYVVNKDTIAPLLTDSLRWKDFIIDNGWGGSVASKDTIFRQRYGRGYFNFKTDSAHTIRFTKMGEEIFAMHYRFTDSNTIALWGKQRNDSLFVELKRSARHFQLEERQFHWLSEANR